MKITILLAVWGLASLTVRGQGAIQCFNLNPIFDVDGMTLLGGATSSPYVEELVVDGVQQPNSVSGVFQGYFGLPGSGELVIPNSFQGELANMQVEVWDGSLFSSYAAAAATPGALVGLTPTFTEPLGPIGSPPAILPLDFGTAADGLTLSIVPIPEPSSYALSVATVAAFLALVSWKRAINQEAP